MNELVDVSAAKKQVPLIPFKSAACSQLANFLLTQCNKSFCNRQKIWAIGELLQDFALFTSWFGLGSA